MNDSIPADGVGENGDGDGSPILAGGFHGCIHIRHQIACAFIAERVGNGVLKPKTEIVPTGVNTSWEMVRLGVGVT
ncbi:hypothetical protein GT370_09900 [Acidocella sp. MX-AZ03]|uniref:hypothetical protein n=1 Tax=Acidocella sp. MX-AZ03 TaxID=2697363 RepID=UPI0022DDF5EE|nr:hypothetical protein [Acidocella sp. MX-AZ03]WBO60991.1 hypothetical protein GT370_09900 [Acidocella sp. MX-AZ03]